MCQLVATLIHLFKCRYECQNFGFWGLFLAGRFCVYITQMNFHFHPFCYLILSYLIPICYASIFTPFPILFLSYFVSFFYRWFVLFVLLYFVPIVSCAGAVSLLTRWLTCHVTTLPHYHVNELPYYLRLQLEVLQLEVLKTCHIILRSKICHVICAWRFENLPRYEVALRLQILQLLGCPSTTPAACC